MRQSWPSALVTDKGRRVLLRLQGRFYDLTHAELRGVLGLRAGRPGLGVTIERDGLRFEFTADDRVVEISAGQLHRRLAKQLTSKA